MVEKPHFVVLTTENQAPKGMKQLNKYISLSIAPLKVHQVKLTKEKKNERQKITIKGEIIHKTLRNQLKALPKRYVLKTDIKAL